MSVDDYRWHYDYARLAWDLGFTFQIHRLKPSLDKNIGHIDVEQVIRERDVATIERYIGAVIEFSLDNDQTSVLDPSFVKIFRLSQLSVQYLLFCKKYLDNTVVLIKKEFTKNNEESKNLKRYLDELKQELANSKKQIKELKSALTCQIASTQNVPVFQCSECPKAFSTEEYLLAHIKRRHDTNQNVGASSTPFQAETDKLQLEIKELKERLNNTEKFIHSDEPNNLRKDISSNISLKNNVAENSLLADLQQKFELLRNHVENELRILQTQKFDQEKYELWFETFLKKLEHTHGKEIGAVNKESTENFFASGDAGLPNNDLGEKPKALVAYKSQDYSESNNQEQNNAATVKSKENHKDLNEVRKNDGTTQTDFTPQPESAICKNCQARRSPSFKQTQFEQADYQNRSDEEGENNQQKHVGTENHLEKFEEMLEKKVTGSIEKLENQMQSFWNKMNEVEKQKLHATNSLSDIQQQNNNKSNMSIESVVVKPQKVVPKPRKKTLLAKEAFKSTTPQKSKESLKATKSNPRAVIKTIQIKLPKAPVVETISLQKGGTHFNLHSDTEIETSEESASSETSDETDDDNMANQREVPAATLKPSNTSTLGARSLTSLKEAAFTPEVLQGLEKELENVLNGRLEELGVSPDWSTLPMRSYQRALNIVTHQANLIQKNITNYMHIRSQILKDLDHHVLERKKVITPQKHSKLKTLLSNVRNKTKVIVKNESKPCNKPASTKSNVTLLHPQKSKIQKTTTPEKDQNTKEEKSKQSPSMYETDTESDSSLLDKKPSAWNRLKITDQTQKAYFDVIQELNSTVNSKLKDQEELIPKISETVVPIKEQNLLETTKKDEIEDDHNLDIKTETQAKGVLKNYPSVGSLQKKKVLFDLESSASDNKQPENPTVLPKTIDGGSTTSIASSVLDGSKTNLTQKKPNDLSDVSDWDLSDMLN